MWTQGKTGLIVDQGSLRFGIQLDQGVRRAYIEQMASGERYFVYFIWQASTPKFLAAVAFAI